MSHVKQSIISHLTLCFAITYYFYQKLHNYMWIEQNNQLCQTFEFKDFSEAFAFMTRVAILAEKMDHHPWWSNVWNTVTIKLNTHDAGDIVTEKDTKLAAAIDRLFDV